MTTILSVSIDYELLKILQSRRQEMDDIDLLVLGAGPGGYAAAFHAADLGLKVALVDSRERPGGVCLNVGCIPSKALLHAAEVMEEAKNANEYGVQFTKPKVDLERLREWKEGVVRQLTSGLAQLADRRGVQYYQGVGQFEGPHILRLSEGTTDRLKFKHAIIATGSRPSTIPGIDLGSKRVLDSTDALRIEEIPGKLLVIGGGYIGLELGTVYAALGSEVTTVEMLDGLLPGVDRDLVRPLAKKISGQMKEIHLQTKVAAVKETAKGLDVEFEGKFEGKATFDMILIAVGRVPNSNDLGLETTAVELDEQGFVLVDQQRRTNEANLFAIGDVAGQPMLAHKAMSEGKVAAEVVAGQSSVYDKLAIPAVVFTNPEVAWSGLTETEAKKKGIEVKISKFPWAASGRSLTLGRTDGLTKLLFEPDSARIVGVGIVGPNAGELIAEGTLAIEMGAVAEDLALTVHAHPTLSETIGEAAEVFLGQATHILRKS
jgi:dihydrolipoamide dehydrogenase